jgi:hypothetical protein
MSKIEATRTDGILLPIRPDRIIAAGAGTHGRSPLLSVWFKAVEIEGMDWVSGACFWSGVGVETAEAGLVVGMNEVVLERYRVG